MKAIKLKISANSKVAKDLKLSYKGKDISASVTEVSFYLCEDNAESVIKELVENSYIESVWQRLDRKEVYKAMDWMTKEYEKKKVSK